MTSIQRHLACLIAAATLAGCVTAPKPTPAPPPPPTPIPAPVPTPPVAAEPTMTLERIGFEALPGWSEVDPAPAFAAFRTHCAIWEGKDPSAPLSPTAPYGGLVGDWLPSCEAAARPDARPRTFFESLFQPFRVTGQGGEAKLTAYYVPRIEARREKAPGFEEPLRPAPDDIVTVDLKAFAATTPISALATAPDTLDGRLTGTVVVPYGPLPPPPADPAAPPPPPPADLVPVDVKAFVTALDPPPTRAAPATLTGRLVDGRVVPYADRAEITERGGPALAWAHPADVYNLQVQGSGRARYPDGTSDCFGVGAQNGYRWRSLMGSQALPGRPDYPRSPGGAWASLKAYLDAHPDTVAADMNLDPSYVFFARETRSTACGRGSSGAILTGDGSLAVDPRYHPYGAVILVEAEGLGRPRLVVAQDTGGAIRRGPLRGDLFLGEGPEAGARAERTNVATPAFFTLLPKTLAETMD